METIVKPFRFAAATERALARVDAGESAYRAAKNEGIALNTIYRALKAIRERKEGEINKL